MRTTVEIPDEQRARLLEIAGARGEKGYSRLVQEAIDLLLEQRTSRTKVLEATLALQGTLSEEEAEDLEARAHTIREVWR